MQTEQTTSGAEVDLVQTPVPGTEEQKPTPSEGEAPPETPEQQEAKKQSKFARRLERQKTARIAAETETRLLREQLAKLEPKPSQDDEPKRDSFESLEDYLSAVSEYKAGQIVDKKLKAEREVRQAEESKSKVSSGEAKVAREWTERETAFQVGAKDYQEVISSYIEDEVGQLSDLGRRSILESEVGPQLLYHLAKNPDEAERISELSPVRQAAELGKLEAKLSPARKASSAPAPITPVGNSGSTSKKRLSEIDDLDEFNKARKAQIAKRR